MKKDEIFKKKFYESISQFITLSEAEFDALLSIMVYRSLSRNDFFIREGQYCFEITFVNSGMMRHFYNTANGEVTRWIALPGTFSTSLFSFISGQPSIENIQAIEPTELFIIPQASWRKLCKDLPIFKDLWMMNMEYHYLGMEDRVYHLISKTADERYEILCEKYPELIRLAPAKYIASMLGIHSRHLNRIRKKQIKCKAQA